MILNQLMQKLLLLLTVLFVATTLTAQVSQNMTLRDTWDGNNIQRSGVYYNDIWGHVDAAGNEYAIIGSPNKIHFVDVTNPTNISLVQEFNGGSSTIWRDFKDYDTYVYAVADEGSEGLIIFDMSALPGGNITKVAQLTNHFTRAHNIYIDVPEGRLYVAGSNTRYNGMWVYDIATDPANPILINSSDNNISGGYVHDIFVMDNIAYCSHGEISSLYIYDYTNANNPSLQATINTGAYNHSSWISKDNTKLVYAEESSNRKLGIIDITGAASNNLNIINTFSDPLENANGLIYHNPFILGDYVIVSSYLDGVTIFDISNPNNPNLVAYYDTEPSNNNYANSYFGTWGTYPFFPSGNIIASDQVDGLFVISTSINLPSVKCNNGVQDRFEKGVDCDGFCAPCSNVTNPPCPANLTLNSLVTTNIYEVSNNINSNGTVPSGANVEYRAGNCIQMNPPFTVSNNARFLAEINPCTPLTNSNPTTRLTVNTTNPPTTQFAKVSNSINDFSFHTNKGSARVVLAVNIDKSQNVDVIVTNQVGEKIRQTQSLDKGVSRVYIDVSKLVSDWYSVTLIINDRPITKRFFVDTL